MDRIADAVRLFNEQEVAVVLHAGDIISPITAKEFAHLQAPLTGVFGNNDGDRLYLIERYREIGTLHSKRWEGTLDGRRFLLIHEPDMLAALAASGHYDVIVYGHTHRRENARRGPTLVVNPGEGGGWITGQASVAILETDTLSAEILEL